MNIIIQPSSRFMSSEWNFTFCRWISFSTSSSLSFTFLCLVSDKFSTKMIFKCIWVCVCVFACDVCLWHNKRYFIIPENVLLWFDMNGNCCFVVVCCYYLSTSLPTVSCQKLDWQTIWPGHAFDDSLLYSVTLHIGTMNKICWIRRMNEILVLECFSILLRKCVCVCSFIVLFLGHFVSEIKFSSCYNVMSSILIC